MWLNFFRRRTQKARPERGDGDMKREDVKRVLFVCTGNICRSPTAEGIALRRIAELGLEGWVEVDSAGTTGYHAGELPDQRARKAAAGRGYDLDALRARQLEVRDFQEFDLVLALDAGHLAHMRRKSPPVYHTKIRLLMEFARAATRMRAKCRTRTTAGRQASNRCWIIARMPSKASSPGSTRRRRVSVQASAEVVSTCCSGPSSTITTGRGLRPS